MSSGFCWKRLIPQENIVPFEVDRIWFDGAPKLFLLEIVFRSTFAYLYCFLLIRLLNARAVAQMSMTDMILVIALGSAVEDLTFYDDAPIFHALVAITVIVFLTKFADRAIHNQDFLKRTLSNSPVILVRNCVIAIDGAFRRDLNTLEVMELLRIHGDRILREVEWAFMEAGGQISVFLFYAARLGLSIVPPLDMQPACTPLVPLQEGAKAACRCCGLTTTALARKDADCPELWSG